MVVPQLMPTAVPASDAPATLRYTRVVNDVKVAGEVPTRVQPAGGVTVGWPDTDTNSSMPSFCWTPAGTFTVSPVALPSMCVPSTNEMLFACGMNGAIECVMIALVPSELLMVSETVYDPATA